LIAWTDRVNVIHGVCTGCHLMVFTLHRMTTEKGVLQDEVCQHWISLKGGKRDHFSAKY
jgi:hypothetical protein